MSLTKRSDPRSQKLNRSCTACRGELYPIGVLAGEQWYRCRDCGMHFCEDSAKVFGPEEEAESDRLVELENEAGEYYDLHND